MRRFMVHFVTETDFVDGQGVQDENVPVEEIKADGL